MGYEKVSTKGVEALFYEIKALGEPYGYDVLNAACLSISICMQRPDIDIKKLVEVVKSTSEYIALQLMEPAKGLN